MSWNPKGVKQTVKIQKYWHKPAAIKITELCKNLTKTEWQKQPRNHEVETKTEKETYKLQNLRNLDAHKHMKERNYEEGEGEGECLEC